MTENQRIGARRHCGVEIIARDPSGHTMRVRCRRRARTKKVGSPEVPKFIEMAHFHHRADPKLFVATSAYTGRATALSCLRDVQLMDGSGNDDLARTRGGTTPSSTPAFAMEIPWGPGRSP
ncbi:MAG: restriction endonuclease [Acidobacteria bacterium]|nr:restriction endonuclease [Acidobacteriota bacterium]